MADRLDRILERVQSAASVVLVFAVVVLLVFTQQTLDRHEALARDVRRQAAVNATVLRELRAAVQAGNEGQGEVIEAMLAEIRVIACEEARKAAGQSTKGCRPEL